MQFPRRPVRFAAPLLLLLFLLSACADDERSAFDPSADRTPPSLREFEIVQENQKVYALWAADEPVRAVVEYRFAGSEGLRHAYPAGRGWAEAGIVPVLTVFPSSTYEVVGVRLVDRAGNVATIAPPTGQETFETEAIAREDIFVFVMIDVGWGDALFLRAPDGTTCLVDAGHPVDGGRVRAFLENTFGVGATLDFASLSHVHEDHVGGFYGDEFDNVDGLIQSNGGGAARFSIGTFLDFADKTPGTVNGPYRDLDGALESLLDAGLLDERAFLETGASSATEPALQWGHGLRVDLLAAGRKDYLIPDYAIQTNIGSVQNNDSMVYRVQYGDFVILLMGDGEFATEQFLQDRWPHDFLRADILKLGHHGSNDSNSERFIDVVSPTVALIPNAVTENPGVEHPYVLERLRNRGIDYYASDRAIPNLDRAEPGIRGDIIVETDGESFNVTAVNLRFE